MARKCSQCGKMGHNSRTCRKVIKGTKIKLFGVQIDASSSSSSKMNPKAGACVSSSIASSSSSSSSPPTPSLAAILNMKKSISTGSLQQQSSSSSCSSSLPSTPSSSSNSQISSIDEHLDKFLLLPGYVSDGRLHPHKRKDEPNMAGVPWTEEEHKTFLRGLEKLGKGDWRGISREFVRTRTPTQVASHAQKYFLRQLHLHKLHTQEKSHKLGIEQAKESKCKASDNSIQYGVSSSPKITSTMHNKHEIGEPLLRNIWMQDLKQTSPKEEINLELTLESGKIAKSPSIVPPSCLISFAT